MWIIFERICMIWPLIISLFEIHHFVINSLSIITVPDDAKDVELAIVKLVTLALMSEDNVDVNCPCFTPPHDPRPQPVEAVSTAGPTG